MSTKQIIIVLFLLIAQHCFASEGISQNTSSENDLEFFIERAEYYNKYLEEDSCLFFCSEAFPLSVSLKDREAECRINLLRCESYRKLGNIQNATLYGERALELSESLAEKKLYGDCLSALASLYIDIDALDLAFSNFSKAKKLFETKDNKSGLAKVYNGFGIIAAKQLNYTEAEKSFLKALNFAKESNETQYEILIIGNLSLVYANQNQYQKAEEFLVRTEARVIQEKIPYHHARFKLNLCRIYLQAGEYEKALSSAQKAYTYSIKKKSNLMQARAVYYLGFIYDIKNKLDSALFFYTIADSLSKLSGQIEITANIYKHKADIYKQAKDFEKALQYMILYKEYSDSLQKQQNINKLYKINLDHQYQSQIQGNEFRFKIKQYLWIGVSCLLLFIILILWLIYTKQKLRMQNIRLQQESLEKTLEQRNKEIATKTMHLQQKNEFISDIAAKLLKEKYRFKVQNHCLIEETVNLLQKSAGDNSWEEFEIRFENVHLDFFKKLKERFPDLTQNEKRLCAYLRLNMNTKEIALLTNTTVGGVEQARFRLRKKLGLHNSDVDLIKFIEDLN